jgi:hypothetical protein
MYGNVLVLYMYMCIKHKVVLCGGINMDEELHPHRSLSEPDLTYRYRTARDAALNPKLFTGTRTFRSASGYYGTVPFSNQSKFFLLPRT